jgi:hypothetical protein
VLIDVKLGLPLSSRPGCAWTWPLRAAKTSEPPPGPMAFSGSLEVGLSLGRLGRLCRLLWKERKFRDPEILRKITGQISV